MCGTQYNLLLSQQPHIWAHCSLTLLFMPGSIIGAPLTEMYCVSLSSAQLAACSDTSKPYTLANQRSCKAQVEFLRAQVMSAIMAFRHECT